MVQIQYFVVERLQRALGQCDQTHRQVQARKPAGGFNHVPLVLDVAQDVRPLADPPHGRDQANGVIWFDHHEILRLPREVAAPGDDSALPARDADAAGAVSLNGAICESSAPRS